MNEEIKKLRIELHSHNVAYYVHNNPTISDRDFDMKMKELEKLEEVYPEFFDLNSPTQKVGSDLSNDFSNVKHEYPMLSLGNTYDRGELTDHFKSALKHIVNQIYGVIMYTCELKFDGASLSLTYENKILVKAVTRGDGEVGDDVTDNVRAIASIPNVLIGDYPDKIIINGEIIMTRKTFDEINKKQISNGEKTFKNPRNLTSGSLKLKRPVDITERGLIFFPFYVLSDNISDSHYESISSLFADFKLPDLRLAPTESFDKVLAFIEKVEKARPSLPFDIDGAVIKIDDKRYQEMSGYTSKAPRWATSFKYQSEQASTELLEVVYQTGKSGQVTPVANLKPVALAGTTVKRATLHNIDYMIDLNLRIGENVIVEKSGEIIPFIIGPDNSKYTNFKEEWKPVDSFPNYLISNKGFIKSLNYHKTGKEGLRKSRINKASGYEEIGLSHNNEQKMFLIHRLVAIAFIDNPMNNPEVNHKNGDKLNNSFVNLEWNTKSENQIHNFNSVNFMKTGENHHSAKVTNDDILEIRKIYSKGVITHKEIAVKFGISREHVGMIIRNQDRVNDNRKFINNIEIATECPDCGAPIEKRTDAKGEEGSHYFCTNIWECPSQVKGKLKYFVSKKIMNLDGLGKATVEQLYDKGLVKRIEDFYLLTADKLRSANLDKTGETTINNIVKAIEKSKKQPYHRVLSSLSIHGVGTTLSKDLANQFPKFDDLRKLTYDQLTAIEDVGETTANSFLSFFKNAANLKTVEKLKAAGLQFEAEEPEENNNPQSLAGLNFIFSGSFEKSRDDLKKIATDHGAKIVSSVSKNLNYFVAGTKAGPSKLTKVTKLSIPIIDEEKFLELVGKPVEEPTRKTNDLFII